MQLLSPYSKYLQEHAIKKESFPVKSNSKRKNFTEVNFRKQKKKFDSKNKTGANLSLMIDTQDIENHLINDQLNKEFSLDGSSLLLDPRQKTDQKKIQFSKDEEITIEV